MPRDPHPTLAQTYGARSEDQNLTPLAAYLLQLMHVKRTNLCVSADVTNTRDLLRIAEEVGDYICVLKTHADIVQDFGARTMHGLTEISRRKKFLVFEDRKFGDIGNTVKEQYVGGPLTIVTWAGIVNCHIFPGPAIITALSQAASLAITQYNTKTSVQVNIHASPTLSATESTQGVEDYSDLDNEDSNGPKAGLSRGRGHRNEDIYEIRHERDEDFKARKQSVVSVSTTISMQSESISPQPAFSRSRNSGSLDSAAFSPAEDNAPLSPGEEFANPSLCVLDPPPYHPSLLLLAQMSSAGNYFTDAYTEACKVHAREHRGFVMGYIAQKSLNTEPDDNFITMTPGVNISGGGDALGQQYNSPAHIIRDAGSDIIIVGRAVYEARDRAAAAREYQTEGWRAYEERVRAARKASFPRN